MVLARFRLPSTIYFLLGIFFVNITYIWAEGTKELEPTNASYTKFQAGSDKVKNYAKYTSPEKKRLYIHIENPLTELINYGFGYTFSDDAQKNVPQSCLYRIKDPNGNIVVTEATVPPSGIGYINNRSEALIGPNTLTGGTGGYLPLIYQPTLKGDYYIEFNFDSTSNNNGKLRFDYFDVTVSTSNKAIKGRLWSYIWSLCTLAPLNPSYAKFFIYTEDSVVTSLDLNGMQPMGYSVMCNRLGTNVSTDFLKSRKSLPDPNGQYLYPQFKIFLNDPDSLAYPSFKTPTTIKSVKINDCLDGSSCQGLTLEVDNEGLAEIYLDLDSNVVYSANGGDILITKFLNKGKNCISWDGKNSFGNKVKLGTIVRVYTSFLTGLTCFPINDPEFNVNGIKVEFIRPKSQGAPSTIPLSYDDTKIGGGYQMDCFGACHKWDNYFGDNKTMNTWWHIFNITNVANFLYIPWPEANSGADLLICNKENNSIKLGSPSQFSEDIFSWKELNSNPFNGDNSTDQPVVQVQSDVAQTLIFQETVSRRGCEIKDQVTVTIHPPIDRSIVGSSIVCAGSKKVEYSLTGPPASSYAWDVKGGVLSDDISHAATASIDWSESPVNGAMVSVNPIDYNDCPSIPASLDITLNPILTTPAPKGDTMICSKAQSKYIYEIPYTENSSYQWNVDPSYGTITSDPNNYLISVNWKNDGIGEKQTYIEVKEIFSLTPNSCSENKFSRLNINFHSLVDVQAGEDITVCTENEKNIGSEKAKTGFEYQWNPASYLLDAHNPTTTFKTTSKQRIQLKYSLVKIRNADGCKGSDSILINVIPGPETRLPFHTLKICTETDGSKEIIPLNIGSNTITWGNVNSSENSFVVDEEFFASHSEQKVYMHAENAEGCPFVDSIFIEDNCTARIFVPKAFTPNGDGINDVVKIFGINFTDLEMKVFSRWGEVVFENKDRNNSWDGTYLGEGTAAGVYTYILSYKDQDKKYREKRGTITLIR